MRQNGFVVEVIKTTVVSVDETAHKLPPHRGVFQEYKVADYHCPEEWSKDGVFICVNENQPMWFDFRGNDECACIPSIQKVNPLTGKQANLKDGLQKDPTQNYMCLPKQMWLDGYANEGKVYQFVVTKSGIKAAVSEFVLPVDQQDSHAVGFAFFAPKNPKPKPEPIKRNYYDGYLKSSSLTPDMSNIPIGNSDAYGYYDHNYGLTEPNMWYNPKDDPNKRMLKKMKSSGVLRSSSARGMSSGSISHEVIGGCLNSTVAPPPSDVEIQAAYNAAQNSSSEGTATCNAFMMTEAAENVDELVDNAVEQENFEKTAMGAGGRIVQAILTDDNSIDYYKPEPAAILNVYFCFKDQFDSIMKRGAKSSVKPDKYKLSGKISDTFIPLIQVK